MRNTVVFALRILTSGMLRVRISASIFCLRGYLLPHLQIKDSSKISAGGGAGGRGRGGRGGRGGGCGVGGGGWRGGRGLWDLRFEGLEAGGVVG